MESRRRATRKRLERTPSSAHAAQSDERSLGTTPVELPVLPVRNTVLLPNMVVPLFIDREPAISAVEAAMAGDRRVLVVAQRADHLEDPTAQDIYQVGTECDINRVLRMPDGTNSVLVQGVRRVRIDEWAHYTPYGRVRGVAFTDSGDLSEQDEALMRIVLSLLEDVSKQGEKLNEDVLLQAMNIGQPGDLADYIAVQLEPPVAVRQSLLEILDTHDRLRAVSDLLQREARVLDMERALRADAQREADGALREQFLRDQMRAIQRELGEQDPALREVNELKERILAAGMPADVQARAENELQRLQSMPPLSPESVVVRTYLDWLTAVPWTAATPNSIDLKRVAAVLNEHHFGLSQVKRRMLEFMAVRKLAPEGRAPILCLAGPPGVGKTSLGRSIADALGRKYARIALGGVRDEAEIRGHRRTYVGAQPGRILQAMKAVGTVNPVIVLDEVDKLASDYRGDPAAALLEVLDPEQNASFSDNYLEVPYDLSRVLFIMTANVLHTIPAALRDRMEVIEVSGYTEEEKVEIATRFLVPRQLRDCGLNAEKVELDEDALRHIIRDYTYEAGVRGLEREIGSVMRRVALRWAEGRRQRTSITTKTLRTYLGPQKFYPAEAEDRDEAGIATGLAWTSAGGDLTTVEALAVPGHGTIMLTGQLGEVMRESAQTAVTLIRSRAATLGIDADFYEKCDIHIHLPAASIPKDGPSAGVTMAVGVISALTGRPIRRDVAMTGELTLRGRVLPVGGVKEKILAAYRAGISTVILPRRNERDLDDMPDEVLAHVKLVGVETFDEVLAAALAPQAATQRPTSPIRALRAKGSDGGIAQDRENPLAAAGRLAQSKARGVTSQRERETRSAEVD